VAATSSHPEVLPVAIRPCIWLALALALWTGQVSAATLPEEKVDALYHRYDGGGMVIDGPSVLVRKNLGSQVSLTGHYYVDTISAASVDVIALASEYTERRTEYTLGADYLQEGSILSFGFTRSTENDFEANTVSFSISQEFFGGLSTVNMGYSRGWDTIGRTGDPEFEEEADRQNFRLGLSQVITKNSLLGLDLEAITNEGFLENPYRQNRFIDPEDPSNFLYQPEDYPETRTSVAVAARYLHYLPYRASIRGEYRYFSDSWEINAHTFELAYVHPIGQHWTLEGSTRYYLQNEAEFYSDLFDFRDSQTNLARDKELSDFSQITLGGGVTYELPAHTITGLGRIQFSLLADYLLFDYNNFRDVTEEGDFLPGEEPLYEFDALVTRASLVIEY